MTAKLFIGNLPYSCTDDDLRALFERSPAEPVSVRVIMDRATGLSRGYGFVEMDNYEAAQLARAALAGSSIGSRNVVIDLAKPNQSARG